MLRSVGRFLHTPNNIHRKHKSPSTAHTWNPLTSVLLDISYLIKHFTGINSLILTTTPWTQYSLALFYRWDKWDPRNMKSLTLRSTPLLFSLLCHRPTLAAPTTFCLEICASFITQSRPRSSAWASSWITCKALEKCCYLGAMPRKSTLIDPALTN